MPLDPFNEIQVKLDKFIRRYYLSALIRGIMLFFGLGMLYALFWVFIEHFFWLPSTGRGLVFWCLLLFEMFLFYTLIFIPATKYFKIKNGINNQEAAALIGAAFPEIKDKLLNTIQLKTQGDSELVLASIQQKTLQFNPFSFERAVKLKDNLKYLKYAIAPLLILAPFYLFGKQDSIEYSFKRMVDYKTTYVAPPPFSFHISNKAPQTVEGVSYKLEVDVSGDVLPESVQIQFDNQNYFLQPLSNRRFLFEFSQPKNDIHFQLFSGDIKSNPHTLKVIKAPRIIGSKLAIRFPQYIKKKNTTVSNFGNITAPEGTVLSWLLSAAATDTISFIEGSKTDYFKQKGDQFMLSRSVYAELDYRITTNNTLLKNHEILDFTVRVIKDMPPEIKIQAQITNTLNEALFFYGQMSDDYGITCLNINYFPSGRKDLKKTIEITNFNKENLDFYYAFPNNIDLIPDTAYDLYFEVFDNYPFPKPNSTRSSVFSFSHKSQQTLKSEQLSKQRNALDGLERAFSKIEQQEADFDALKQNQQQKDALTFNDREKIKAFLERQKQQDEIIKNYNKKMDQALERIDKDTPSPLREALKDRLARQNKQLEHDEKLLDELKALAKDLKKEDLMERLEDMAKQNKSKQRSLEQMLELTKRYYVKQKAKQIQNALEALANKQRSLSDKEAAENTSDNQDNINKAFNKLAEQLEQLREKNQALSKPTAIPDTSIEERSIQNDQADAKKQLQQNEQREGSNKQQNPTQKAQKAQKKAALKMLQLASQMAQKMSGGGQKQMQEDVDMLRQILDNLLLFSFEQEVLMQRFKSSQRQQLEYATNMVDQKNIRTHFEHVDDSLFVISLRQPSIAEKVNKEISNVYYNIDKALELFSQNQAFQAAGAQQYAVTATNNLADMLSNVLNSMEMQMEMSPGNGEGDMQLPDIIMSQEALQNQAGNEQKRQGEDPSSGSEGENKVGEDSSESQKNSKDTNGKMPGQGQGEGADHSNGKSGSNSKQGASGAFPDSEESSEALMRLYQKQNDLRQSLERLLKEKGYSPEGNTTLEMMKKLEQNLINQGVSAQTQAEMQALKYQLLKLERALKKQGIDTRRQSNTNTDTFDPQAPALFGSPQQQLNSKERLNRQTLPLRQDYKRRIQKYFKLKYD
ncbi:MAG: DUF4175 family protein [Flavobacteriaceae bacterium]